MSQKIDPSVDKSPKVKKSINIDAHIDERITKVAHHLGCTPHSYLVAKIGEAVSRDFVKTKKTKKDQKKGEPAVRLFHCIKFFLILPKQLHHQQSQRFHG